jgi:tetratricopeptide (TPR) repeat protein
MTARKRWLLLAGLAVLLAAGAVAGRYLWAWHHLRAGEAALERYQGPEALRHLEKFLQARPSSVHGHLLAGRAARRAGDLESAERHLRQCRRLRPGKSEEIDLEWTLLRVTLGDLDDNEAYLLARAARSAEEAPLVLEALAEGYTRLYQVGDALRCLERWLEQAPDNPRALFLRGNLWWHVQVAQRAVPDYRRVREIDPGYPEAGWRLARCLVEGGGYSEALPLLEQARAERPGDPEVLVYLARCEHVLGRPGRARELLDEALRDHPEDGAALRTRGQQALLSGRPEEAEHYLRRAVRVAPTDHQARWSLAQALRQQHKEDEASAERALADRWKDRRARLGEITTHLLGTRPADAALRTELGALLIELGHAKVGESWLQSALRLSPGHAPAHAALASYYQSVGDAERAAYHRRQAP